MGEPTSAILVALIGTIGAVVVAYVTRGRPAAPPPPAGEPDATPDLPQQAVADQADRAAAGLDAVLDELVEKRAELQQLRRNVWRCEVEHCPVRDRLRKDDDR